MDLTRYELDNGMKVLLKPTSAAPVVACNVWVGVGSADEEPEEAGLAHVHEHMLFKGTDNRQVGQIAREVEAAGGHINAFTSFDQTCYYVVMSSRYLETGLDILADAVQHSSFDAGELERELEVIQEEIKRGKDNPSRQASLELFETAYREHPYRLPVIGTSESVASFERDDVVTFFRKHYRPENMTLVLVGDFDGERAEALVEEYFGSFSGAGPAAKTERTPEPRQSAFRGSTGADDINQAHLRIGFHIPPIVDEDVPALDLLGAILGYGDSSHLNQTIKREQQLVNAIQAGAYTPKDAGLFMVSAQYQLNGSDRSDADVLEAIAHAIFRFRHVRPSQVDLERARTIIESQEVYGKQTVEGLAMKLGRYQMTTGDPEFEERYYEALGEVTPDDVRRVARAYLQPENCTAVLRRPEQHDEVTVDDLEAATRKGYERAEAEHVDAGVDLDEAGIGRIELPDGPTLIVQQDPSVQTFSVRALTLGGVRFEGAGDNGINKLLSRLIDKGTRRWSATEIAHRVESMAGSIDSMAGRNSFGLSVSGLSQHFEESFELFAGCLLEATMPGEEFEREKRLQLEAIAARRDRLASVNFEQFNEAFFSPHPYAMPSGGRADSVGALDAESVRAYYERLVDPRELVIAVVGDVDAGRVEELTERYFGGLEGADKVAPSLPEATTPDEPVMVVGDLEKEQAHIIAGFEIPPLAEVDKPPLDVLHAILSGQGGRFFYE
ncbi:MAG: M16 family metallopeptidase, partial [Persicimonas sp.]